MREFPRDAVVANQAGNAIALAGGSDREEYRVAFMERLAPAYGDDWWFQSALAFAYHEVDRFEESRPALRAVAGAVSGECECRAQPRPHHLRDAGHGGGRRVPRGVAGADTTGARRSIATSPGTWRCSSCIAGRYARALEIFERDILGAVNPRSAMTDGTALLWRFRLDGKPDGPLPWRSLADLAERVSRPGFLFGEVHAALAYASCGNEAALGKLMDGLRALDAKGHPIAGTVALPLVQGTAAFAAGDHAGALAHFEPVVGEMHRIGGSHAQWELYEETMVACYLALQRYDDAARLVRRRLQRRASPRDLGWLDQATARARRSVQDHGSFVMATHTPAIKQIAAGLRFPEGPVAMPDGSGHPRRRSSGGRSRASRLTGRFTSSPRWAAAPTARPWVRAARSS